MNGEFISWCLNQTSVTTIDMGIILDTSEGHKIRHKIGYRYLQTFYCHFSPISVISAGWKRTV